MSHNATAVQVGDLVADRYCVDDFIAEGGMGLVVAATDLDSGDQVALKLMRDEAQDQQELVERFVREARIAAELHSPHVVGLHDAGTLVGGAPYLAMELLDGEDLAARLERLGRLDVFEAVDIVLQAARGLAAAHGAGVVHRDVKPANLFLAQTKDGRRTVKLLDFGLSKLRRAADWQSMPSLAGPRMRLGTLQYMAPEQWLSPSNVDGRADVWSLGVVLYELVTGRRPFDAQNPMQLLERVTYGSPPPMSDVTANVPAELEAILERCLIKNPAARCSIGELTAALEWIQEVLGAARSQDSAAARVVMGPQSSPTCEESVCDNPPATLRSTELLATARTEVASAPAIPEIMIETARDLWAEAKEFARSGALSCASAAA